MSGSPFVAIKALTVSQLCPIDRINGISFPQHDQRNEGTHLVWKVNKSFDAQWIKLKTPWMPFFQTSHCFLSLISKITPRRQHLHVKHHVTIGNSKYFFLLQHVGCVMVIMNIHIIYRFVSTTGGCKRSCERWDHISEEISWLLLNYLIPYFPNGRSTLIVSRILRKNSAFLVCSHMWVGIYRSEQAVSHLCRILTSRFPENMIYISNVIVTAHLQCRSLKNFHCTQINIT